MRLLQSGRFGIRYTGSLPRSTWRLTKELHAQLWGLTWPAMRANRPVLEVKLQCDPWSQTLNVLRRLNNLTDGVAEVDVDHAIRDKPNAGAIRVGQFKVCVTGRPSTHTATISWCGAGCVYYVDQAWHHSVTTRAGVYATSGEKIHKGDPIYKPSCYRATPMNMDAMILAAHIDRLVIDL